MARVVILGAGISGHTAALHLKRRLKRAHEVIVVSPNAEWNWIPSNIWVGVGRMTTQQVTFALRPIYRRKGIDFRQARAVAIRPEGEGENASAPWTSSTRIRLAWVTRSDLPTTTSSTPPDPSSTSPPRRGWDRTATPSRSAPPGMPSRRRRRWTR